MNNGKPQGMYLDMSYWEELIEDIQMLTSVTYKKNIKASRASGLIEADKLR